MRKVTPSACCSLSALLFMAVVPGLAQGNVASARVPESAASTTVQTAPQQHEAMTVRLRRPVSLKLDNATLAAALEEIDRQAELGLVYSSRVVPLGRRVTVELQDVAAEDALREVLRGTEVDVAVTLAGQIVLVKRAAPDPKPDSGGAVSGRVTDMKTGKAIPNVLVSLEDTRWRATTGEDGSYRLADVAPGTYTLTASRIGYAKQSKSVTVAAGQEVRTDLVLQAAATELEQVIVTGTVVPTERKAIPTPISVINADDIQRQNLRRVDQVFRGQVPGGIAWDQGPFDYFSTVFVRGASSLSFSPTLKTFIDGVEVADASYIATIDPNSVDRIEITRGPQASTLYGAGALSGVMQIFTKKGELGLTRPEVTTKLSTGGIGGFDGSSTAFQTDNSISVTGGEEKTSYNFGGSYAHTGEWAPSYHSTNWGVSLAAQTTHGPLTLSSSLRYADKTLDDPWDTRLQSYPFYSRPFYLALLLRQQTYGVTGNLQVTKDWQHTLTLGYDRSSFGFDQTQPRLTTPADSFLSAFAKEEGKVSLLYHTDLNVRFGDRATGVLTAGVNHDAYDYSQSYTFNATRTNGNLDGTTSISRTPWTNTGYFGQIQVSLADRFFLTGGLRAERNANFGPDFGTAWSPRVGASYVVGLGLTTMKLRLSYGEGIRAPDPGLRDRSVTQFSIQAANPSLAPERQRGVDGGVELYVGHLSLGATYYNQRALDLIQNVPVPKSPPDTLPTFQFQNVSRVKNQGWEFEGHMPIGSVQFAGTYSITNSTVQGLPPGFAGAYQVGDRVTTIPHTTAGATVTYSPLPETMLTANMTLIGHWIDVDYLALYGFYYGGQPYRGSLRAYWIQYPTVTKFAVGVRQQLTKGLTAFARVENVGNTLRFEQNNLNLPSPRSVMVGANVRY
jgi:outer membrane receptor protein involved in Fe transport